MRQKVLLGAVLVAGCVLAPFGGGAAGTPQALECPSAAGLACTGVSLVYGEVCYGTSTDVPTIGFVTVDVAGGPTVECPV